MSENSEEYILLQKALNEMKEKATAWAALATNYDSKKNLSLAKNISAWYHYGALPCTEEALQKSGQDLTTIEYRGCVPRPDKCAGLIITEPEHPLMEAYLNIWATSDDKRNKTRQREILEYIRFGVISVEQASAMLKFDDK